MVVSPEEQAYSSLTGGAIEGKVAFFGSSSTSPSHLRREIFTCWRMWPPAHLRVGVLEGGGEDGANVGHVDEHQGDPNQCIQYCDHLNTKDELKAGDLSLLYLSWS